MRKAVSNYVKLWLSEETNMFSNWLDAFFGLIVQIVLPSVSLGFVLGAGSTEFPVYGFPIMTICAAAMYDSYNRLVVVHEDQERQFNLSFDSATQKTVLAQYSVVKTKLCVRIALNVCTIALALLFSNDSAAEVYRGVAYAPIGLSGISLIREMGMGIRTHAIRKHGMKGLSM